MTLAPPAHQPPHRPQWHRLLGLIALVVALHWLVLQGMPNMMSFLRNAPPPEPQPLSLRTIAPAPPPPLLAAVPKPKPAQKPRPAPLPPQTAPASPPPAAEPASTATPAPDAAPDAVAPANAVPAATEPPALPAPVPATIPTSMPAAEAPAPQASAPAGAAKMAEVHKFLVPAPVRIRYDVKGVVTYSYTGGAEMVWNHDGANYNAALQITKFGFNLRTWTSKGTLSDQGIAPTRFGDKGRSSEIAAHFQRDKGIVSFSSNAPDAPLTPGAQDHLSLFFELAGMLAAEPQRFPANTLIAFQSVSARGSEAWAFRVGELETLDLPGGAMTGIKLTREHDAQYDTKVEVWLAPTLSYLPIRIRLSQTNGDFAELLWSSTRKAD